MFYSIWKLVQLQKSLLSCKITKVGLANYSNLFDPLPSLYHAMFAQYVYNSLFYVY